jgi:peptidyl-prolyl cis-trans isomerase C
MSKSTVLMTVVLLVAAACTQEHGDQRSGSVQPDTQSGGQVLATYGNKRFTTEDFRREVERLPPRSRIQLTTLARKRQFVDNYILNDLLGEEGRSKGYDRDPEITRQVEELQRRLVVQRVMKDFQEPPNLTDEQVRAYYDQNQRLFSGAQVRVSHILVKDEALAKSLHEQLLADPSKFEELAKANSTDTATAARGGDLGFFGQGRMVAEFERAAFALENPGDISEVVKSPFGFHIIKLTERKDGRDKPFDEVKDRIRVTLANQKRQEEMQARFEALRAKAKVTIHDDVLQTAEIPGAAPSPAPPKPSGTPGA